MFMQLGPPEKDEVLGASLTVTAPKPWPLLQSSSSTMATCCPGGVSSIGASNFGQQCRAPSGVRSVAPRHLVQEGVPGTDEYVLAGHISHAVLAPSPVNEPAINAWHGSSTTLN